jgi:hypothetical protein
MKNPLRPIGRVREMILTTGLDFSHLYDDLVISDHSVFIIQFDSKNESRLHLYFNYDCDEAEKNRIYRRLKSESIIAGLDIGCSGHFILEQVNNAEEIIITFYKDHQDKKRQYFKST